MPRLDHQAQIWGQGSVVRCPRCFVVFVGWWNVVAQFAGTFLNLAFVVGFGVVFVFFGHGFHFVDRVGGADERSPGDAAEGVAGGTDFAIDLKAAAETGSVRGFRVIRRRLIYAW